MMVLYGRLAGCVYVGGGFRWCMITIKQAGSSGRGE